MTLRTRIALALAAFPVGWGVREGVSAAVGGLVVLAAIGACALGLERAAAARVAIAGVACFVAVHLIAYATTIGVGLALGAIAFAAVVVAVVRRAGAPWTRGAPLR